MTRCSAGVERYLRRRGALRDICHVFTDLI